MITTKNRIFLGFLLITSLFLSACFLKTPPRVNPFDPDGINYFGGPTFALDTHTVALWRLGESSSTNQISEAAIPITCQSSNAHVVKGKFGNALQFQGPSYAKAASPVLAFSNKDFTLEMLVSIDSFVGSSALLFKYCDLGWDVLTAGSQSCLYLNTHNYLTFKGGWIAGMASSDSQLDVFITHNQWIYFVLVRKTDSLYTYINGKASSWAALETGSNLSDTNFFMGNVSNPGNAVTIDEVKISDYAKNSTEISNYWFRR